MTDFTKEFIAEARESITEPGVERYICIPVQLEMLDEIERLQSRIAELEALVNVSEGLYERIYEQAARIAELEAENDRLQDAWFKDETICPDGSLKPKVSTLLSRIAELEAERRWIPVSERLPETDGQYIGYTNTGLVGTHWLVDGHFVVTYSCEQNWLTTPTSWILESASGGGVYVTHWMPLPESPNDTQTQTIVYGKESEE